MSLRVSVSDNFHWSDTVTRYTDELGLHGVPAAVDPHTLMGLANLAALGGPVGGIAVPAHEHAMWHNVIRPSRRRGAGECHHKRDQIPLS